MHSARYLAGTLAVVALLALAGCHGPAPGLDPQVTFDFPVETQLPYLPANAVLVVEGDIEVEASNPVTEIAWTQSPAIGIFSSTTTMATSWRVRPEQIAAITAPVNVTLTVTVKTLLQGERRTPLHLVVMPASQGAADPAVTLAFPGDPALGAFSAGGVLAIDGTVLLADPVGNPVTGIEWIDVSGLGAFTSPSSIDTHWQVTSPAGITEPTAVMLLVVVKTLQGGETIVPVHLTLLPEPPPV